MRSEDRLRSQEGKGSANDSQTRLLDVRKFGPSGGLLGMGRGLIAARLHAAPGVAGP